MKALGEEILKFIDKHAGVLPDFDSEYDDKDESFTSPDASILYFIGLSFQDEIMTRVHPSSSWESGGYNPYTDKDAREWHDRIITKIKKVQGD